MSLIVIILLVVALVLFVIATIGVPSPPRFNLLAAGLAFCVLAMLAGHVKAQTPQSQQDYLREQRAYEREISKRSNDIELRDHTVKERYDPATCREWRRRVEAHPRLLLPRRCYRRW